MSGPVPVSLAFVGPESVLEQVRRRWVILTCVIHPSDTSDAQWAVIEPSRPPVNTGGRRGKHPRRAVVDAALGAIRDVADLPIQQCWKALLARMALSFRRPQQPGRDAAATGSAPDLW